MAWKSFDDSDRRGMARELAARAFECNAKKKSIWNQATHRLADDLPSGGGSVTPIRSDHDLRGYDRFKDNLVWESDHCYSQTRKYIRDYGKSAAQTVKDKYLAQPYPEGAEAVLRAMEGRHISKDEFVAAARKYGDSYPFSQRLNAMAEASGIHERILHRVDMQMDSIKRACDRADTVASARYSNDAIGKDIERDLENDLYDLLNGGSGSGLMGLFTKNKWPCRLEDGHDYGIYSNAEDYGVSGGPTRLD